MEHAASRPFVEELPPGDFVILLEVPVIEGAGPVPFGSSPIVSLEEVRITGPAGPLGRLRTERTQTAFGGSYAGAIRFTVSVGGTHEFDLTTSQPTRALIEQAD